MWLSHSPSGDVISIFWILTAPSLLTWCASYWPGCCDKMTSKGLERWVRRKSSIPDLAFRHK